MTGTFDKSPGKLGQATFRVRPSLPRLGIPPVPRSVAGKVEMEWKYYVLFQQYREWRSTYYTTK